MGTDRPNPMLPTADPIVSREHEYRTAPITQHSLSEVLREPWASHIVGESPAFREVIARSHQFAASPGMTVLLIGETGTGKELLARGIHAVSPRTADPFLAINCAAIPETLLETELFGQEAGSFPDARTLKRGLFEVAGTGTLFLGEVGDLPLSLQAKLLSVVEGRTFRRVGGSTELELRARIVAGASTRLEPAVDAGLFRDDFFCRLNAAQIELPPLRARDGDIGLLARYFVQRHSDSEGLNFRLSEDSLAFLESHEWPGNIWELRNVIERAFIRTHGSTIEPRHLSLQRRSLVPTFAPLTGINIHIPPEGKSLEIVTHEVIQATVGITCGNMSAAARLLGISRPTLARKLRENGLVRRTILTSA